MDQLPLALLRAGLAGLAALIGAFGVWIVAAEGLRPALSYFPVSQQEAEPLVGLRGSTLRAAEIGVVRGDLWTAAALAEVAPRVFDPSQQQASAMSDADFAGAQHAAVQASRLAPHDSRNWLMLAGLDSRRGGLGSNAREALKLSYYTGPSEFALMPARLLVAAGMTWDEDLQTFVKLEIDRILLERADLKPAIAAAYRAAIPPTRPLLETILTNADPAFLASLNTNAQH